MTEKFWKKDKDKNWITQEEETAYPHLPNHEVRNLIKLTYINTPEILYHLQHHYQRQNIYTTAGKILLAVNPFMVTDLYTDETKSDFLNNKEGLMGTPHIYQTANEAILSEQKVQNFLISGESGSGKTETTKKILDYLALQYQDSNQILPMILEFNTILEAFGNASTQRNHNSSRFGKFIQINIQNNLIYANIRTYLLEKVRLIGENLTNYHIFYSFGYEKNRKIFQRDDWNTDYLQKENLKRIWEKYIVGYDWANIEKTITFCIELLENKTETIYGNIGKLLSEKTLRTGEEFIKVPLDKTGSKNVRDTLVMVIYEKLFQKIVGLMNEKLGANSNYFKSFGILDIFGFEVFNENGFEQLCINYTNETLQSIFNRFVFEEEIKLFESEGILRTKIIFDSETQSGRLEFFDKFFALLDEKSIVGAKDSDLLLSLPNNKKVIHKKLETFVIYHYADNVEYKLGEFTEKNVEKVNYDIQQFMSQIMGEKQAQVVKKKGGTQTITSKFRDELGGLMRELGNSYLYLFGA
jgi:myosin heavy subunit